MNFYVPLRNMTAVLEHSFKSDTLELFTSVSGIAVTTELGLNYYLL